MSRLVPKLLAVGVAGVGLLVVVLLLKERLDTRDDTRGARAALSEQLAERGVEAAVTCVGSETQDVDCEATLPDGRSLLATVSVQRRDQHHGLRRDTVTLRDYAVRLLNYRFGDQVAAEIPGAFARAFEGAALAPSPPSCPPVVATQHGQCAALFDGGRIDVVVTRDGYDFPGVVAARELEALGASLRSPLGEPAPRFLCAARAYRRGQRVRCPNTVAEGGAPTLVLEVEVPAEGALHGILVPASVDDSGGADLAAPARPR